MARSDHDRPYWVDVSGDPARAALRASSRRNGHAGRYCLWCYRECEPEDCWGQTMGDPTCRRCRAEGRSGSTHVLSFAAADALTAARRAYRQANGIPERHPRADEFERRAEELGVAHGGKVIANGAA